MWLFFQFKLFSGHWNFLILFWNVFSGRDCEIDRYFRQILFRKAIKGVNQPCQIAKYQRKKLTNMIGKYGCGE